MKFFLVILLITISFYSLSETSDDGETSKPKLVIPEFSTLLLSKNDVTTVNKLLIRVLTEQKEFQTVIVNKFQATSKLIHLKLQLVEVEEDFIFTATTYIPNKQKKIRSLTTKRFQKNNLFRKVENTLRALFHLELKSPPSEQKKANSKQQKRSKERRKKKVTPAASEKAKNNFRDRLLKIKSEIPESLVKAKNQIIEEKEKTSKSKNSISQKAKKISNKSQVSNKKKKKQVKTPKWARVYHVGTSFKFIKNNTTDFRNGREALDIESDLLVFNYNLGLTITPAKYNMHSFNFIYGINTPRKENDYSFEAYPSYILSYIYKARYARLTSGINKDSIITAGLSEQGVGLSSINISVTSLYLEIESKRILNNFLLAAGFKVPINYEILSGEGLSTAQSAYSSFNIALKYDMSFLLKGLVPKLEFGQESYSSGSNFKTETSFISLIANFTF